MVGNKTILNLFPHKVFKLGFISTYSFPYYYVPSNLSILSNLKNQNTANSPPLTYCPNYAFSSSKKIQNNQTASQRSDIVSKLEEDSHGNMVNTQTNGDSYEVIEKNYEETNVPGASSTRKYSGLSEIQKKIINSNEFNLSDPNIVPKTASSSSFAGLSESITQISLGKAKIREQNEVFLSEVDPFNIPADLDIRFDSEKQIRIIGAMVKKQSGNQTLEEENHKKGGKQELMKISADTVEHKSMSEFMEKEFNGVKAKVHYGKKRYRRLDLLLGLLIILILEPTVSTLNDYYWCLESIEQIEKERMKQITNLKQKSYRHVLFENTDFNRQI